MSNISTHREAERNTERSGSHIHARPVVTPKRIPAFMAALALFLTPALAFSQGQVSGNAGPTGSGAAPSGTLGAVGVTANGSPAGTSGTNPGVSSASPGTSGTPTATSGTTLRPVGTNVDGSQAGTSGTTPGSQTLSNPLNRNPANRNVNAPDIAPAADASNSSSRPTLSPVTSPDSRDTLVTPDPSRDSTTNPVANPAR